MEPQVACKQCQEISRLVDCMREQRVGDTDVIEMVLICPHCQLRTHICFLTPRSIKLRKQLEVALVEWQLLDVPLTRRKLSDARRAYEQSYETDQTLFASLVEKTEATDVANS